jgi:uncharacterized protein with HEPN domain
MRDDNAHLLDMLLAARKIQVFVSNQTEADFKSSDLHQSAVMREIQVIGEAARLVSQTIKQAHPEIDWANIAGMRNRVIHEYFRINLNVVWEAATEDIPKLVEQLQNIIPPDETS